MTVCLFAITKQENCCNHKLVFLHGPGALSCKEPVSLALVPVIMISVECEESYQERKKLPVSNPRLQKTFIERLKMPSTPWSWPLAWCLDLYLLTLLLKPSHITTRNLVIAKQHKALCVQVEPGNKTFGCWYLFGFRKGLQEISKVLLNCTRVFCSAALKVL